MTSPIGVARPRPDAPAKVRGATRYAADRPVPGLLHARLVLATHAHARIRGIDADAARELPGVVAVLTAADLPIKATGRDKTSPISPKRRWIDSRNTVLIGVSRRRPANMSHEGLSISTWTLPVMRSKNDVHSSIETSPDRLKRSSS